MARMRRDARGFSQVQWGLMVGGLVLALVVVMVPVVRDVNDRAARTHAAAPVTPPEPAGREAAAGRPAPAEPTPATDAGVDTTNAVGAPSGSTSAAEVALAENGIAVDAVTNGSSGGEVTVPEIPGVAEMISSFNGRGSLYLRVRWLTARSEPTAISYHVACQRVSEPVPWIAALRVYLEATQGLSYFSDAFDTTTTATEVVFAQQMPVPTANYTCTVTPMTTVGAGAALSTTAAIMPDGFSFPVFDPLQITGVAIEGAFAFLTARDSEGNVPQTPILPGFCTDRADGTVVVGGADQENAPGRVEVGPLVAGHSYDCVVYGIMTAVSAAATVTMGAGSAGLPPRPVSTFVSAALYSDSQIATDVPAGLASGTRYGVRLQCAAAGKHVTSLKSFVASGAQETVFSPALRFPVAATWQCAASIVNDVGEGPSFAFALTSPGTLGGPSSVRLVSEDGAQARFRFNGSAEWIAAPETKSVGVACSVQGDPLEARFVAFDDLTALGGNTFEVSIPVEPTTTYTCDFALIVASMVDWVVDSPASDPVEFTTSAGQARDDAPRPTPPAAEVAPQPAPVPAPRPATPEPDVRAPTEVADAPRPAPVVDVPAEPVAAPAVPAPEASAATPSDASTDPTEASATSVAVATD